MPELETHGLRDQWHALRRRWWLVVLVTAITVGAALMFSFSERPVYQATAQVLVRNQNLIVSTTGIDQATNQLTADRSVQTQALLAATLGVADRAVAAAGTPGVSGQDLLDNSQVVPNPNADFLDFNVSDHDPSRAVTLANAYAQEFINYRQALDQKQFNAAYASTEAQIKGLRAAGTSGNQLYFQLVAQAQQFKAESDLQAGNVVLAQKAVDAPKIKPTPLKAGAIALLLGIVLGIATVFLAKAIDTRLRSSDEVGEALGIPLLGRAGAPPKDLRRTNQLAMLTDQPGAHAEAYRMLRTNLDFANLRHAARVIMITSAAAQEGKSTTVANLAIALGRSGRRVALVDLDLRAPMLATFFGLEGRPGVTDVALGRAELDTALVSIALTRPRDATHTKQNGRSGDLEGTLEVLPAGSVPPDPAEFMSVPALAEIIAALRRHADVVLIDSAPLLAVSDGMALASLTDAMLLVVRVGIARRSMMHELRRLIEATPNVKLGFVLTNAGAEAHEYGYGYGYNHGYGAERLTEREQGQFQEVP